MDIRPMDNKYRKQLERLESDVFANKQIDIKELYKLKHKCIINGYTKGVERIELLESILQKRSDDLMNRRLNILTVWSTIFLPLSFYTGLWGMNFDDVPLISNDDGFWVFLSLVIITGSSMWWFFKKNKWI